jgi:TrmH family RNA methyltransferase
MNSSNINSSIINSSAGIPEGILAVSFQHPLIKELYNLIHEKKVDDESLFAIEGLWAFEKIIKSRVIIKTFAFCPEQVTSKRIAEIVRRISGLARNTYTISDRTCDRLSNRDGAEGFFMDCSLPARKLDDLKPGADSVIAVLDGLEKPGNIGSIIRSVDGAGGDAVIICNRKACLTNYRVVKSSMGSSLVLPVIEAGIDEAVQWLGQNGYRLIVTDLTANKFYCNAEFSGRIAVVAGNEIHGISDRWRSQECERVIIPMLGGADSLNVGFATTMVVYEASLRQKGILVRE